MAGTHILIIVLLGWSLVLHFVFDGQINQTLRFLVEMLGGGLICVAITNVNTLVVEWSWLEAAGFGMCLSAMFFGANRILIPKRYGIRDRYFIAQVASALCACSAIFILLVIAIRGPSWLSLAATIALIIVIALITNFKNALRGAKKDKHSN